MSDDRTVAPDEHVLARAIYVAADWGRKNAGDDWDEGRLPSFELDRYLSLAHRLLASGVLGVPADQVRAETLEEAEEIIRGVLDRLVNAHVKKATT